MKKSKVSKPLGKFFAQFDRVFCISLPGSKDRRQYIRDYFREEGISNYQFFDATDRNDPAVMENYQKGMVATYPPCYRCGKLSCGNDECSNVLITPQVATFISYLRLWQTIARSDDIQTVLIVEDDVRFTDYASDIATQMLDESTLQKSGLFDTKPVLLRFGWALCDDHQNPVELSTSTDEIKMANPCHSINRAFAEILLKNFRHFNHTVDTYQHYIVGTQVDNITIFPPLSYELSWSVGAVDSLIHPKPIRLEYLKNNSPDQTQKIAGVEQEILGHIAHIMYRPLLVIGHPRCGSGYISKLLQLAGLDVGHEKMGRHGISSWMFAVTDQRVPFALNKYAVSRLFSNFQFTIHHVRNPLTAIPSIIRENRHSEESFQFRQKHIQHGFGIDLAANPSELERAILSYIYWNKLVEINHIDLVVRVEDEEQQIMEFLMEKELINSTDLNGQAPAKDVNSSKPYKGVNYEKPTITDEQWSSVNPDMMKMLNEYSDRYGYPTINSGA